MRYSVDMTYLKKVNRLSQFVLGMSILLASAGCSGFSEQYDAALKKTDTNAPDPILGAWTGQWVSNGGHSGGLQCVLEKIEAPANSPATTKPSLAYRARFHARFMGILSADYDVVLTGEKTERITSLQGSQTIGGFGGGLYHYDAKLTPTSFEATYKSDGDNGIFTMKREAK